MNLVADDVFVNVAGGIAVDEPAADLGIVAAVASSVRNRPIKPSTAVFGEVGLAGEVRGVSQAALRVREAAQMGFTAVHRRPTAIARPRMRRLAASSCQSGMSPKRSTPDGLVDSRSVQLRRTGMRSRFPQCTPFPYWIPPPTPAVS